MVARSAAKLIRKRIRCLVNERTRWVCCRYQMPGWSVTGSRRRRNRTRQPGIPARLFDQMPAQLAGRPGARAGAPGPRCRPRFCHQPKSLVPYQKFHHSPQYFSTTSILRDTCDHDFQRRTCDGVAELLDPGHLCCSPCGALVAVLIFFSEDEDWLNLLGEPRSLQGYDVAELYWMATHLRGTT